MTGWMVFGCIVLLFALISFARIRVIMEYKDEIRLTLKVAGLKIKLLPKKQKKKKGPHSMNKKQAAKIRKQLEKEAEKKRQKALEKQRKKQEKKAMKMKSQAQSGEQGKKKLSLSEVLDLVRSATDVLSALFGKFFGHLKIDVARLHINIAMDDAATTAIAYGAVTQAAMYLCEVLDKFKGIDLPDARDISINADFLGEKITADLKISASLRVWHLPHILIATIARALKHLPKILKTKGQ